MWLESLSGNRGQNTVSRVKGAAVGAELYKFRVPARSLLLCRPHERTWAEAECHGCKLGSSGRSAAAGARGGRQLSLSSQHLKAGFKWVFIGGALL